MKHNSFGILKDITKNKIAYLLVLPAALYTLIFGYQTYPYLLMAFQKFDYTKTWFNGQWIGFKNFEFFFKSNYAFTVTWNTVKLNILFIIFVTITSVALAIFFNEIHSKAFVKVTQSMMIFPTFISWIVVSFMLYGLFSTDYGIINRALNLFGIGPTSWYQSPGAWTYILIIMKVWRDAGMNAVIYLASITGMDKTMYEAAEIDGAGRWQQCRYITIPLLMPTVIMLTIFAIGKIMFGDFGMIYALIGDNGVLYPTTDVIDTYVFRSLRLIGDPSTAMAIGLFQSVVGFTMVFFTNLIARKYFKEGALY